MLPSPKNLRNLVGITVAVLAVPLSAQGQDAETVVNASRYQETVDFEDLDLRLDSDKRMLVMRVRLASKRVCGNMAKDNVISWDDKPECAFQTLKDTRPQIRRAFAIADTGQKVAIRMTVAAGQKKV